MATVEDANFAGIATGILVIEKAVAGVSLASLSQTYDGEPKPISAATDPVGLPVVITYDGGSEVPVGAGSYEVVATVEDLNYAGSATGSLVIEKAAVAVTLSGLTHTYDGGAKEAGVSVDRPGLWIAITYDGTTVPPSDVGSYELTAIVNEDNYEGSASGFLRISVSGYASWQRFYFSEDQIANGRAEPGADPDGDGLRNLTEHALGTDPNHPNVSPVVLVRDVARLEIRFPLSPQASELAVAAEASSDLIFWEELVIESFGEEGGVQWLRARDIEEAWSASSRYLRLRFTADSQGEDAETHN